MTGNDKTNPSGPSGERRPLRERGATIGGYAGLAFGLLGQLSVASETPDQFQMGQAALFVLALMIAGYAAGWLLGPAIARLLGET